MYPKNLANLIESLKYFPGIGEKSAERMAFSILNMSDEQVKFLTDNVGKIKKNIRRCSICNNLTDQDICNICSDSSRDQSVLCIVEDPKTVFMIEKIGLYHGFYHVLNGLISTTDGINPEDIRLDKLVKRLENSHFKEAIIAVKPCLEGEMTSLYIKNVLSGLPIVITRIASGIPIGADLEYVDQLTMERAFDNRKKIS